MNLFKGMTPEEAGAGQGDDEVFDIIMKSGSGLPPETEHEEQFPVFPPRSWSKWLRWMTNLCIFTLGAFTGFFISGEIDTAFSLIAIALVIALVTAFLSSRYNRKSVD